VKDKRHKSTCATKWSMAIHILWLYATMNARLGLKILDVVPIMKVYTVLV